MDSRLQVSRLDNTDTEDEIEIELRDILYILKRKFLVILLVSFLSGTLGGIVTHFFLIPVYSSTSSLLVLSKETTLTSLVDLQLGATLTKDYTVLIKSTPVLEQVIRNMNLDTDTEKLEKTVTITNPVETRILEITVRNHDREMAKNIVDEIAEVSSAYIGDKMEVIPPKIIEKGKLATKKTFPNMILNIMICFLSGMLLCSIVVLACEITDDTLKTEEDIEKYLGISVLAKIPDRKDCTDLKSKRRYIRRKETAE